MAEKIRGGIGQIEISNNATFNSTAPNWVVTIPGIDLPQDGQTIPEPQAQTVELADGRSTNVGYRVELAIRVKKMAVADQQKLEAAKNSDTEVWVRYSSTDLASDGQTPKLVTTFKKVLLTRTTPILLTSFPGLCAAIIEGNAAGTKLSDIMETVITE